MHGDELAYSRERPFWTSMLSIVSVFFGLMTLREGGGVVLFDGAAREAAGDYVGFVVWFNFLAGFVYIFAGVGLWLLRRWAVWMALAIACATLVTFCALGVHILGGGAYELRTVIAMSLRFGIWLLIGIVAYHQLIRSHRETEY